MTPPIIAPAEALQADDPEDQPVISVRFGVGLAVLTAALLVGHFAWVRAGMPVPSFLERLL